jgi:hypothetical protein
MALRTTSEPKSGRASPAPMSFRTKQSTPWISLPGTRASRPRFRFNMLKTFSCNVEPSDPQPSIYFASPAKKGYMPGSAKQILKNIN